LEQTAPNLVSLNLSFQVPSPFLTFSSPETSGGTDSEIRQGLTRSFSLFLFSEFGFSLHLLFFCPFVLFPYTYLQMKRFFSPVLFSPFASPFHRLSLCCVSGRFTLSALFHNVVASFYLSPFLLRRESFASSFFSLRLPDSTGALPCVVFLRFFHWYPSSFFFFLVRFVRCSRCTLSCAYYCGDAVGSMRLCWCFFRFSLLPRTFHSALLCRFCPAPFSQGL